LAERLIITSGGVTRIITSLEEKGFIERSISSEDRRGINVILTTKGKKIVKKIQQESQELHGKILEQIKPENRKKVLASIQKLSSAIDCWLEEHQQQTGESV
jgi:DNA-binding MarR family transcriptional regulator